MDNQDIVSRFGGKDKVIEATKTMGIDDVYCFELDKWFTQRYWEAKMKDDYKGVTLRELVIAAKV